MSEPSTAGMHDAVVGDDLRYVGVPLLLFASASLADGRASAPPGPDPHRLVAAAAATAGVELDDLALFGTDAYLVQRALGEIVLGDG